MTLQGVSDSAIWPALPLEEWQDTYATLHLWTQIVGKVQLALSEWINHYWHITLHVSPRGLCTSPIPHGKRIFQIDFDFIDHELVIRVSDGKLGRMKLQAQSVATFYKVLMAELERLELPVTIWTMPSEIADAIPFEQDEQHHAYAPDFANRLWRILLQTDRVFKRFRSDFIGKCSPVQFYWGAADLAMSRFSGRPATPHPGGVPNLPDYVSRECYSHEQSNCGFWPGSGLVPYPAFYAYAYPEPDGFSKVTVAPVEAFYSPELGEYILPYDAVRQATEPDVKLLEFLQSTYKATARLGKWDRELLERKK